MSKLVLSRVGLSAWLDSKAELLQRQSFALDLAARWWLLLSAGLIEPYVQPPAM